MKRGFLAIALFALPLVLLGPAIAGEWIAEDTYTAPRASITIDGDPSDWAFIEPLTAIEFRTTSDEWVVFEEYGGGIWNGPDDQLVSVAFAWDSNALYSYILVVDDEFQNSDSEWNGDAAQYIFADAARSVTTTAQYNIALNGNRDAIIIGNEKANGGGLVASDIAIVRDDAAKTTFYEVRFSPAVLGLASLGEGDSIGVGVCVNDGDIDTPGQAGWGGWGPHAAVFGKNGDKTGLVTLGAPAAVSPASKAATTWGSLK